MHVVGRLGTIITLFIIAAQLDAADEELLSVEPPSSSMVKIFEAEGTSGPGVELSNW